MPQVLNFVMLRYAIIIFLTKSNFILTLEWFLFIVTYAIILSLNLK